MTKLVRSIFQRRHWTTQVAVTVGAVTCATLTIFTPELVLAKELVGLVTTMVWVWGP